jgi:hypothetical protein
MPPVLAFVIPYQVGNITFRASTQRDFILHCHSPYLFAYRPFKHPDLFHLTFVIDFKMGGNEALHVNPFVVNNRTVDIHITTRGSDWYWAVTSIMGTTMLAILGTSFLKPASNRIFHYVLALDYGHLCRIGLRRVSAGSSQLNQWNLASSTLTDSKISTSRGDAFEHHRKLRGASR